MRTKGVRGRRERRFNLRGLFGVQGYFGLLSAVLLLTAGLVLAAMGYFIMVNFLESAVKDRVDAVTRSIKRDIANKTRQPALNFMAVFSQGPVPQARTREERTKYLPLLQATLRTYDIFGEIFVGYDNGDMFVVKAIKSEQERLFFGGPPGTSLVMLELHGDFMAPRSEYFFYNPRLVLLGRRTDESGGDRILRKRAWYADAMQADGPIRTKPTISLDHAAVGIIIAQKSRDGRAVAGLSIHLDSLSRLLASELPTPNSHVVLFSEDATPIAMDKGLIFQDGGRTSLYELHDLNPLMRLGVEKYRQAHAPLNNNPGAEAATSAGPHAAEAATASASQWISEGGRDWLMVIEDMDEAPRRGSGFMVLLIPRDEIFSRAGLFLRYIMFGVAGLLLLIVPACWMVARHVAAPLRLLTERTRNPLVGISPDEMKPTLSPLTEINGLMHSVDCMCDNQRKIISIIGMIGGDSDFEVLPGRVLREIITITGADGGVLMIMDEAKHFFEKAWFCWDDGEIKVTSLPDTGARSDYATYRALDEGRIVLDSITRDDHRVRLEAVSPGFAGHPEIERLDLVSMVLRDRTGEPLGSMSLFKRAGGKPCAFSAEAVDGIETIVAAASVVLETQNLIKSQYDLRDALIRILAGAIDTKSPYTGGHCARVPVIFQMLLEAAHDAKEGPLKDFRLDEAGREEARLASWLHDCGKVTTPEYVMDKATKLETLYDRIHEIRTRFEVLKRDAAIACLKARLDGADPVEEERRLQRVLAELDDDFAFVASCNLGSEHMDDSKVERLKAIAARTWTRTMDKRLGVSRDESARLDKAGVCAGPVMPVLERLLMDNPEHIIPRGEKDQLPEDNPWGFQLDVPEALYNRGELYNLSVRRGTLTAEERYKINDHITRTIMMLEDLPLPKHLGGVAEIAGAHHETMDGRGYPRKLRREEMSWGARMMAIADIFEALTAWDRPYKSSKTLREALEIMEGFRDRNHIDPHLYNLFLEADIPRRYASQHLKPEQNDLEENQPFSR